MNKRITPLIDQATKNLRVKQIWDKASMTWDMHWEKLAEQAEGKGINVVPYIVTGSGLYLMPEFNRYEFAKLIVQECAVFLKDNLDDHFAAEQLVEHFGVKE